MEGRKRVSTKKRKVENWNEYLRLLEINCVILEDDIKDKLIWTRNDEDGELTAKKGYEVSILEKFSGERAWWWKVLWECNSPIKTIHFLASNE